jgi:hypothetical protein
MVLGRLGRKPSPHPRACALSCPSPFAGRGSPWLRPSHCAPLFVARDLGWCDHVYSRCGGHTSESRPTSPCSAHRLLSWVGASWSNLAPTLRFAPVLCPKPSPGRAASGGRWCTRPQAEMLACCPLRRSWPVRGRAMPNFAFWGFSEVRLNGVRGSSGAEVLRSSSRKM